ncbi:MAG: NAD(P)-dependent oxidoreductase, partial [Magnetovibrio sp.]|nr:NAD(P)-dependent oxidoreductase [Magnetovibrio sp.]
MKVAFLGLGVMGYSMAGHLQKSGHDVTVYNRTDTKSAAWAQEFGGQAAATPKRASQQAKIVFCCVGNDDDLRSVILGEEGAFAGMGEDTIFVDNTTASAEVARELYAIGHEQGVSFIDAPVSGGESGAQNGTLTVMCGGDLESYAVAAPIIDCFARAVALLGPVGSGQLTKMVNQTCIAGILQGLAEAINFSNKAGLDTKQVLDVISKGAAASWQMDNRGETMINDKFDYGFAVD